MMMCGRCGVTQKRDCEILLSSFLTRWNTNVTDNEDADCATVKKTSIDQSKLSGRRTKKES